MTFDNTNRGALFKNTRKTKDNHPDYTGTLDVEGKEWALAAWLKESKAGKKYMSVSVSKPMVGKNNTDDSVPL